MRFASKERRSTELLGAIVSPVPTDKMDEASFAIGEVMTTITAVVESGLLRPTKPLALAEGTRVELLIVENGGGARPHGRAAASILAEIAALPTAGGDSATGQNHDQILYGEQGAR